MGAQGLPAEPQLQRREAGYTPQLNFRAVQRKPTAKDIEEHNVTHLPYKGWCEICVAARAVSDPHRRVSPVPDDEREAEVAKVYFDHAYFRTRRATPARQVLVAVCGDTGVRFTVTTTNRSGTNPHTIALIEQGLRTLGLWGAQLVLRGDGDYVLQDLLNRVASTRQAKTWVEQGPRGDSQAHGRAERNVRALEETVRVQRADLEARLGRAME